MPSSACACEHIHDRRRNRLSAARARDLVWVFSNLRLRRKVLDAGYEETVVEWEESEDEVEVVEP